MSVSSRSQTGKSTDAERLLAVLGLSLTLAYAVFLFGALMQGQWLIDTDGNPVASDFIGIWSAGRAVLDGDAAGAYDWATKARLEAVAAGYAADSFYPWFYPPPFLLAAATFALLPVIPASIAWLIVTTPVYVAAICAIIGRRGAVWIALGFPGALWNASAGQNGFLTAAAIGGTLTLMERHPTFAGVCLGMLTCKPQLGVLFPLVLIASGRWRVFVSAAITAIVISGLSLLAFGPDVWEAFRHTVSAANRLNFELGGAGWNKWQSLFGIARAHGADLTTAWILHGAISAAVAIFVIATWRTAVAFDLKAGALAAGALIVTPYIFIYDLAVLAVPVGFLLHYNLAHGFPRIDIAGLIAVVVLLLSYLFFTGPVGLLATVIVFALILRHAVQSRSPPSLGMTIAGPLLPSP